MMRDYRDAKTMAKGLRRSLADLGTDLTHSQSLELIAQAFGFDNWNILAAKIEAARPALAADKQLTDETLHCGFCKKSQHDVKLLIAGPDTFICNECVAICDDVIEDNEVERHLKQPAPDADPVTALEAYLAGRSSQQMTDYLERAEKRIAEQQQSMDDIDAGGERLPGWLTTKPAPELAKIRARLAKQIGVGRKSVEIVGRVLAARS
jgi:hypothetical protein